MKIKEIREMSSELNEQVYLLKEQLFHLQATGQLTNGKEITMKIARVFTVLRERELGIK